MLSFNIFFSFRFLATKRKAKLEREKEKDLAWTESRCELDEKAKQRRNPKN